MSDVGLDQAAVGLVLTTLMIVYVVGVLWGAVRHFNFAGLFNAALFLGVMYVGWTLRDWPTKGNHGMFMTLLIAWRDSIITLAYYALKMVGVLEIWHWLQSLIT